MDQADKKILNILQEEFPLTKRPFATIGDTIGLSEQEVIKKVKRLKQQGYIRRIGPVLEPKKLEYTSTLCGVHVGKAILMDVVKEINRHRGVTHNYERDGTLNLWFTITARNAQSIERFLSRLEQRYSLKIYRFPKKRVFKIMAYFPV